MSILLRIGAVRGNNCTTDHIGSGQDTTSSDTDAHDIPLPEEVYHRQAQTYPGCFGLPYQDHNYGAPPPLSPTPPRSPQAAVPKVSGPVELEEEAKVPAVSNEEEVVEDSITRCICGFLHDDGYMICCDKCSVWQHIDCMEIDRNNIPENYCCEVCEPRRLDVDRAKMIQLRKREEIDTSATDTDPEEPANALASLGRKPVQSKPKGSKQRRVSKAGARLLKTGRLAKSQHLKREKKLKMTKKEKENRKDISKKVGRTGVSKSKKLKKKLNTSLIQNKAEIWNTLNRPLYCIEEAKENEYSPEILEFLSHAKTNGIHSPHSIGVFPEELLVRLYQVSDVKKNVKGLEATDLIVPGRAVIEFKGKVMLRQHYQKDLLNQSQPYVLYYSKFEGLDLCIDASAFGGDARFIRRSCTPNAEMCHIIDNGNLHFIVQAKKEIAKGSEITIPFDFSYQESPSCVDCACGKTNCPVIKFWKKIKPAQKSPEKPKRKRQASGEGRVRRNSQSKNSSVRTSIMNKSPVKNSPQKSPPIITPLVISPDDSSISIDDIASVDSLQAAVTTTKAAPISRRSSRATLDVKEERDVKAAKTWQIKEHVGKATAEQEDVHVVDIQPPAAADLTTQPASESEADSAGECPRKLTREERKMEAIMKAFEKMAKREERRKEALARLDKKHVDVKEEISDKNNCAEVSTGCLSEFVADKTSEKLAPIEAVNCDLSPETESKITVKQEDPMLVTDSPQKATRLRRVKRKRRSSRVMSAIEPLYTIPTEAKLTVDDMDPSIEEIKEESLEQHPPTNPSAPTTAFSHLEPQPHNLEEPDSYMFHKKKKYLFSDWTGPRSSEGHTDSIEDHGGEEEMFVSCASSPRNAMEHIQRRNSASATYGRIADAAKGNAKKRWLRQAMHETVPLRVESFTSQLHPLPTKSSSAAQQSLIAPSVTAASIPSPTGSPSDFVTPLKKRRVAPEFLPSITSAVDDFPPNNVETSPADNSETSTLTTPSDDSEPSGNFPTTSTSSGEEISPSLMNGMDPAMKGEHRRQIKASCLFGRSNRNGLVGNMDSNSPVSNFTASGTIVLPSECLGAVGMLNTDSSVEEHSVDSLSSVSSHRSVHVTNAGSSVVELKGNPVDSASANECNSANPGAPASSSSVMCVANDLDSGSEMPLVDSSGTAVDTDLAELVQQDIGGSENACVCSSDNEVSLPCVNNPACEDQADRESRPILGVVAESSSSPTRLRSNPCHDQDGDVSESACADKRDDFEDEGNEASGSVSGSEEIQSHLETLGSVADCQVNSSQDSPLRNLLVAVSCSTCQGEAECNELYESLPIADRICDSRQMNIVCADGGAVSSAFDNSVGDRERTGVSSAQDIVSVSSLASLHELESLAAADADCGPSSSTQALYNSQDECTEDLVCNSSDVSRSDVIPSAFEESNVDSTTQSGRLLQSNLHQCDTADSHLEVAENEESFCDSNCDEQTLQCALGEGAKVSSSGPADSQCNEAADSGLGVVNTSSGVVSSSASVSSSSSQFSSTITDSGLGMQLSSMFLSTSSSALCKADVADILGPSQSASITSPVVSDSSSGTDSAWLDPSSLLVSSAETAVSNNEDSESDSVDSSEQFVRHTSLATEQCEASTSNQNWRMVDDSDSSIKPGSSDCLWNTGEGDTAVSPPAAKLVLNGSLVGSSLSEDNSNSNSSNPCAAVSSSEAQAVPAGRRKVVSLSEYRSRRKEKPCYGASTSSSTSPKSSSEGQMSSQRVTTDSSITLAPLPLFELFTVSRENRDPKDQEKREKPMSLSDRLRIEFGLETTIEEEEKVTATGLRMTSQDIPPPPPLPPNGIVGGVALRRTSSTFARTGSTENEDDVRQLSASGFSSKSPSGTATTTTSCAAYPSTTGATNHTLGSLSAHGQASVQPGLAWLAKLNTGHQACVGAGLAGPSLPHQQHQPTAGVFGATIIQQQHAHSLYNGPGPGNSHLPNGSHPQGPVAFSAGVVYQAAPGQPQAFTVAIKQQQAPPPPPPPTSAYSSFIAQSQTQTHCLHPQTSPLGSGQQTLQVRSISLAQTRPTGSLAANRGVRVHHASVDPSPSQLLEQYHFDQHPQNQTVKRKSPLISDRKRH